MPPKKRAKKCKPKPPSLTKVDQTPSVCWLNFKGRTGKGLSQQHKYAVFANASYQKDPASYLVKNGQFGYVLYKPLSNKNTFTFVNVPNKEVIISYRGTDWSKMSDIWQNLGTLTNSSVFKQRERANLKLYDQTAKTFPGYSIVLTGHSAGGGQAISVAGKRKAKAVVFNAASSPVKKPVDAFEALNADIQHYSTTNLKKGVIDPVSLVNPHPTETVEKKEGLDAHTIENFLPGKSGAGKKKGGCMGTGPAKIRCEKCDRMITRGHYKRHLASKAHKLS
jgi:hypothetical protein